jgi:hypothetical protein
MRFSQSDLEHFDQNHSPQFSQIVKEARQLKQDSQSTRLSCILGIMLCIGLAFIFPAFIAIFTLVGICFLFLGGILFTSPWQAYENYIIRSLDRFYEKAFLKCLMLFLEELNWSHLTNIETGYVGRKGNHGNIALKLRYLSPSIDLESIEIQSISLCLYSDFRKSKELFSEHHFRYFLRWHLLSQVPLCNWHITQVSATKHFEFDTTNISLTQTYQKNPSIQPSSKSVSENENLREDPIIEQSGFNTEPSNKRLVEMTAIKHVLQYERESGRTPVDVSSKNLGYDIESVSGNGKRYIEVKGFGTKGKPLITENEKSFLLKNRHSYLYLVYNCLKGEPNICVYSSFSEDQFKKEIQSHSISFEALKKATTEEISL